MASRGNMLREIRIAAPRLSQRFFSCHQCTRSPFPKSTANMSNQFPKRHPRSWLRIKSSTKSALPNRRASGVSSPLGTLSHSFRDQQIIAPVETTFFPKQDEKIVGYWLLGSAASVFGIVVFGGLTRLTESGLSITEWRPVTGSLPPMSNSDWDSEFSKYRSSPEFALLNPHMTLDEFKKIYYMEWTHRIWGRVVGITFILPFAYLIATRRMSLPTAIKGAGIGSLIGFQGFLGWWMVKSGLKDDLFEPGSHPRVSQYRLVSHLGTAFVVYTSMLWMGLSILRTRRLTNASNPQAALAALQHLSSPRLRPLRISVGLLAGLIFTTSMAGGLVAGLDAGMIYNEFPYMGQSLTPPKSELFSSFYSRRADGSDIWWRNMLENPSMVQLDHRILATTTFTAVMGLWAWTRFGSRFRGTIPRDITKGVRGVVHLVWLQVILGISTLIYLVPVPLAAAHQAGSLALLTGAVVLGSRVWVPRRLMQQVTARARQLERGSGMHGRGPRLEKLASRGSASSLNMKGSNVSGTRSETTLGQPQSVALHTFIKPITQS